jgi:hypothetical protein
MSNLYASLVFLLFPITLSAQTEVPTPANRPMHNLNLSLLGDASLVSINFEVLTRIHKNAFISTALGVGYQELFDLTIIGPVRNENTSGFMSIPHHVTGNFGFKRGFLEMGLGGTYFTGKIDKRYVLYPILGFRLQPLKQDRAVFKLFINIPITEISDIWFVPFGTSIGVSF